MLFEHTCTVQRYTNVGTNGRRSLTPVHSGMRCLFLPMSPTAEHQQGFELGSAYQVFFPTNSDVQVADKLLWGGQSFIVSGVRVYTTSYAGHIEVVATREVR